jgi:hypothetical protein
MKMSAKQKRIALTYAQMWLNGRHARAQDAFVERRAWTCPAPNVRQQCPACRARSRLLLPVTPTRQRIARFV